MTDYEREAKELALLAYKSITELMQLAIVVATIVGDGTQPLTREEGVAVKSLKQVGATLADMVGAFRLVVLGKREAKVDGDLWRLHDQMLRRDFQIASLHAASIDDVWFTERGGPANPETVTVAKGAAAWCRDDLALDRVPRVRWFSERVSTSDAKTFTSARGTTGMHMTGSSDIWVHAGLEPRDAIRTVAHESKHVAQASDATEVEIDYSARASEQEAHGYGKNVALRLWGKFGHGPAGLWLRSARAAAYPAHGNF